MTKPEDLRTAAGPSSRRRVAGGVGLGLFGHVLAMAPVVLTTVLASSGGNNMGREYAGIIAFFVVEVVLC